MELKKSIFRFPKGYCNYSCIDWPLYTVWKWRSLSKSWIILGLLNDEDAI